MELWTDDFLTRVENEGEVEISHRVKCIFFRYSFTIVADTSIYTLPTGITDILSITWLGIKLDQFNPNIHSFDVRPHSVATSSKPSFYLVNPYDTDKIRFYPTPDTSYSAVSDAGLITGAGIESGVCLSGFKVADNSTYRVPSWLRTQLTGYYRDYRKYLLEGKGQSLQAAQYYKRLFNSSVEAFNSIVQKVPGVVEHRFGSTTGSRERRPARPVLPSSFPED